MLLSRTQIEEREKATLASYAVLSSVSEGREYPEDEGAKRTCFQRDRDRVIHSKAFRRLKGKTQVFVAHYGDHYRSRLTHSMEVAQISRDLARTLNLNEDLAETIALAHDLGHTPFGHAGQDTMSELMKEFGQGFEHNEQSRRVVELLETKKPNYPGLNLTFEVRDGLIKHRTPFDHPKALDVKMPSLEAQIVNIADEIAYLCHDVDDGLRAGILELADIEHLSICKKALDSIDGSIDRDFLIPAMISRMMRLLISDLENQANDNLEAFGIITAKQVVDSAKPAASFSEPIREDAAKLKAFLYDYFYRSVGVAEYNMKGQEVIRTLFSCFMRDFKLLPEAIRLNPHDSESHILVKDYIAGMTDQFALDLYNKLR